MCRIAGKKDRQESDAIKADTSTFHGVAGDAKAFLWQVRECVSQIARGGGIRFRASALAGEVKAQVVAETLRPRSIRRTSLAFESAGRL